MERLYFLQNFFSTKPHHLQRGCLPTVSLLQMHCYNEGLLCNQDGILQHFISNQLTYTFFQTALAFSNLFIFFNISRAILTSCLIFDIINRCV